jgi:hypothetical protein
LKIKSGDGLTGKTDTSEAMNNPLTARFRYRHRNLIHFGVGFVALIFLLVFFCCAWPELSVYLILIAVVAWIIYVRVMRDRLIWVQCDSCKRDIATNTPWVCAICTNVHTNATLFPFVGVCSSCGDEPKAYQCHHEDCGELIYLSRDNVNIGYATSLNMHIHQKQTSVKTEEDEEEITKLDKDIEITKRKVKKAELDLTLKGFKDVLEPQKPRTRKEAIEESFANFEDRNMTGAEVVRRKKAEVAEKYKDNPAELERQNRLIDQWARDHLDIM